MLFQLAICWMIGRGITTALWGARQPGQLAPVEEVAGWWLDAWDKSEIDQILRESVSDPVGPEFMAPASRGGTAQLAEVDR
jgi:hypothetical protein